MKVSLYCAGRASGREYPKDSTEVELTPSISGVGAEYRVWYNPGDGTERKLLSTRDMGDHEIKQTAAALLALIAHR